MAYSFVAASTQYMRATAGAGVTGLPLTISAWVYPTANSGTTTRAAVVLHHATDGSRVTLVGIGANAYSALVGSTGANSGASAVGQYTTNNWLHMACVHSSTSNRIVYANNVSATDTTSVVAPSSLQRITIGANHTGTSPMDGIIAEVAVWSVALTASEIQSLYRGMSASMVRPQSLAFYAPLIRDIIDVRGGLSITNNNNATITNHSRIYY
jgi:hypothetical protein